MNDRKIILNNKHSWYPIIIIELYDLDNFRKSVHTLEVSHWNLQSDQFIEIDNNLDVVLHD